MNSQGFFTSWVSPKNGFLLFPGYDYKIKSFEFSKRLLKEKKVFTMPSIDYGIENHIRLGFGRTTPNDLTSTLKKVDDFIKNL
jgi:aspartate/methionine/tyrosine aminotransferase